MTTIRKPRSRERLITQTSGDSKVQDGFGNDTDVNRIVERFTRTGIMPTATREGQYADVSGLQEDLTDLIAKQRQTQAEIRELEQSLQEEKQKQRESDAIELERLRQTQAQAPEDSTQTQ